MVVGALIGCLVVALALAGGYLYAQSTGADKALEQPDGVVVVFEAPAEDGATVASLLALVSDGRMHFISPDSSATVQGTSATHLADAFVFGRGEAVMRALESTANAPHAYISVPQETWARAVDEAGGVPITLPEKITVFDGRSLTTIPSGEQTLTAAQTAAALRGAPYLLSENSRAIRIILTVGLAQSLAGMDSSQLQIESNLPEAEARAWIREQLKPATEHVD
jgi:hypothetical protein